MSAFVSRRRLWLTVCVLVGLYPASAWAQVSPMDRLKAAIVAVCPTVKDLSIGTVGVAASVQIIDPPSQQACAQATIDAFDWSAGAQATWQNLKDRVAAKATIASVDQLGKLVRCVVNITLGEVNLIRAALVHPVTSITRVSTTATATTPAAHGLATNDVVGIHGADVVAYNGLKTITVTGATTFTFTVAGSPATPALGSLFYAMGAVPPTPPRTQAQLRAAIDACLDGGTQD